MGHYDDAYEEEARGLQKRREKVAGELATKINDCISSANQADILINFPERFINNLEDSVNWLKANYKVK